MLGSNGKAKVRKRMEYGYEEEVNIRGKSQRNEMQQAEVG